MINHVLTFSDIILYWDLTDAPDKDCEYFSYLDGVLVKQSNKTHVTFRNIREAAASVEIYTDSEKKNLFYKNKFTLPHKPKFIDISKPPYNAVGDGTTLNTDAIQHAVNDCKSGECVYIPDGVYLTGTLNLHSNMSIYIDKNAVLLGSDDPKNYLPMIKSRFEGLEAECYSPLINIGNIEDRDAIVCENILIHGGGKILGGGRPLAENVIKVEKVRLKEYMASLGDEILTYENEDTIPGRYRPKLINISCSKNIVMDDLEIGNGACWNIHMIYSDNILTCNTSITSKNVWNGDGWDPDSSTNCTLFNCTFNTGDDCVAIKSGKNPEGNIINKPTKNIKVFDCRAIDGHALAIGSEMSGGVSDIYVWDCDMRNTTYGFQLKGTKKRGGYVKNIYVSRFTASRIAMTAVRYNDDGVGAPEVPVFSDIHFDDLTLTGISHKEHEGKKKEFNALELVGFDDNHMIENVTFNNLTLNSEGFSQKQSFSFSRVKNISFSNLNVK